MGDSRGLVHVTVTQEVDRNLVFVDVAGELDVLTGTDVRLALAELIDRGHRELAVDLRHVPFVDSTGLSVLVGALQKVQEKNGSLDLICADGQPARVLKQTGLNTVFHVYPSRQARLDRSSRIP